MDSFLLRTSLLLSFYLVDSDLEVFLYHLIISNFLLVREPSLPFSSKLLLSKCELFFAISQKLLERAVAQLADYFTAWLTVCFFFFKNSLGYFIFLNASFIIPNLIHLPFALTISCFILRALDERSEEHT